MVITHTNSVTTRSLITEYTSLLGDWEYPLQGLIMSDYMNDLLFFIDEKYKSNAVMFPDKEDIFKAFRLCSFNNLKVVIIGSEPFESAKSTGLAFANYKTTLQNYWSPILSNFHDCIKNTVYENYNFMFDCSLENWAKQGILLLNTCLTNEYLLSSKPQKHAIYWRNFIRKTIEAINDKCDNIVFVFMDDQNDYFKKYIGLTRNHIISNNSLKLDKDSQIFNKINEILYNSKKEEILW